jgi:hypothetical protein
MKAIMNRRAKILAFSLTRFRQTGAVRPAWLLALCVALALCAFLGLLAIRGCVVAPRFAKDASLLLLGLTNRSTANSAVFCLTNNTTAHFAYMPQALEQMKAGAWVSTPLNGNVSPAARNWMRGWIGLGNELRPHQALTLLVPPPTNNATWRLIFMCQEQAQASDPVFDTVKHLIDTNAMKNNLHRFSGRRYYVTSPEIGR